MATHTIAESRQVPATSARSQTDWSAHGLIAPSFDELGVMFFLVAAGTIALMLEGWSMTVMNLVIPCALMFLMGKATVASLRRSVATVWSPLIWLRAAVFFYAGFGTLVVLGSNNEMLDYVENFFVFYEPDILKFNIIMMLFVLSLLSASKVYLLVFGGRRSVTELYKPQPSSVGIGVIGGMFVVIGLAASLIFIIPYQFGFVSTTFPAIMAEIAQASYIGLFLSVVASARQRSPMLWVYIATGIGLAFLGLLAFSKASITMPVVMLMLAYFYLKPSLNRVAVMICVTLGVFFLSAPLVDHGRNQLSVRYGGIDAPALPDERIEMLSTFTDPRVVRAGDDEVDYASLRFSYVNVGTFVINLRDAGQPGRTYDNAAAIFVPRFMWPDKPIITEMARQLSYDAVGNWNNSVSAGLPSEAYWNGGYFGVIAMGAVVGLIISLWSIYNLTIQVAGAWHLFPVALLGVRLGSRFDGFFVPDILGPIAFGVVGHFILSFVNAAIARRNVARSALAS